MKLKVGDHFCLKEGFGKAIFQDDAPRQATVTRIDRGRAYMKRFVWDIKTAWKDDGQFDMLISDLRSETSIWRPYNQTKSKTNEIWDTSSNPTGSLICFVFAIGYWLLLVSLVGPLAGTVGWLLLGGPIFIYYAIYPSAPGPTQETNDAIDALTRRP